MGLLDPASCVLPRCVSGNRKLRATKKLGERQPRWLKLVQVGGRGLAVQPGRLYRPSCIESSRLCARPGT